MLKSDYKEKQVLKSKSRQNYQGENVIFEDETAEREREKDKYFQRL